MILFLTPFKVFAPLTPEHRSHISGIAGRKASFLRHHAIQTFLYCARELSYKPSTHSVTKGTRKKTIASDDIKCIRDSNIMESLPYGMQSADGFQYTAFIVHRARSVYTKYHFYYIDDNEWWNGATDYRFSFYIFFYLPPKATTEYDANGRRKRVFRYLLFYSKRAACTCSL